MEYSARWSLAIQKALMEYTEWVSAKAKGDTFMLGSTNELRGIFYNKLHSCLKELGFNGWEIRSNFHSTDIVCTFKTPGYIHQLSLGAEVGGYLSPERRKILGGFAEGLIQVSMDHLTDRYSYELTCIVNKLKSH